jgi:hypothetical protein
MQGVWVFAERNPYVGTETRPAAAGLAWAAPSARHPWGRLRAASLPRARTRVHDAPLTSESEGIGVPASSSVVDTPLTSESEGIGVPASSSVVDAPLTRSGEGFGARCPLGALVLAHTSALSRGS